MIQVGGQEYCIDPAGGVLNLLGKKWALPRIGIMGNRRTSRFSELRDAMKGMGSKALTERLKELQRLNLVTRNTFAEVPVRTAYRLAYRLTRRGGSLRVALVPLLGWAATERSEELEASLPGRKPALARGLERV